MRFKIDNILLEIFYDKYFLSAMFFIINKNDYLNYFSLNHKIMR